MTESEKRTVKYFEQMKKLCRDFLDESKEESPDYAIIAMDIAYACTNYLLEIGEIGNGK